MLQDLASNLCNSFTAFIYEGDGVTVFDMESYDTAEEAVTFAKRNHWDSVMNDATGEIVWRR